MVQNKELGVGQSWDRGEGWCWESDTGTNDPCVTAAAVSTWDDGHGKSCCSFFAARVGRTVRLRSDPVTALTTPTVGLQHTLDKI